ncbi:glycosyltransferase family 1 protein [Acinetobacter sp. S40]|uniref:glycosyltransferase family protein n=1 Tax=unclassified Acinetobacter TaxID=196816 RepID=UPI001909952F|nr:MULTISPECIES: glycosyltransferase [unclassified Acinetobacter]MBJ9985536.1 glycosyltransferase family 1 protein [Acinetobacter sp. S40]MBK0064517.1 glycosyltransferase family 1 protein [Acinetobacter sp. S55]MBK0067936.1 glycosyltransferase family 1 protein [Acinetobacter sp. S54]
MKILHIANFGFNKQGAHFYCTDRKISAGLIENGHFVYDFSFRDMARMGTVFKTKKLGANWANKEILKIVDNLEPDLVLIGHSDLMSPDVLKQIKYLYPKTKIAFWYVDPLYLEHKLDFVKAFSPYLDAIFCTTAGEYLAKLKQPHLSVGYMPNIGHRNVETLVQFAKGDTDKTFIFCGVVYKEPEREKFLKDLAETLQGNRIKYQYYGCFDQAGVYGKAYYQVLADSKMGLNYSRRNDVTLYSSDRIVQLTGNGLLTFCPRIPDFEKLYNEQEVVYFNDQADLARKIQFFDRHPEQMIQVAQAGWEKTRQSFNAKRITQYMLEVAFRQPLSEEYEWSHEVYA